MDMSTVVLSWLVWPIFNKMQVWADGLHFAPRNLEQKALSYLHFIETSQGNTSTQSDINWHWMRCSITGQLLTHQTCIYAESPSWIFCIIVSVSDHDLHYQQQLLFKKILLSCPCRLLVGHEDTRWHTCIRAFKSRLLWGSSLRDLCFHPNTSVLSS